MWKSTGSSETNGPGSRDDDSNTRWCGEHFKVANGHTFRDRSLDYFGRRDGAGMDRLSRLFPEFSTQFFISAVLPWVDHPYTPEPSSNSLWNSEP